MIPRQTTPKASLAHWTTQPQASAPPAVRFWLNRPGALTGGLRALGQLQLSVLHEAAGPMERAEQSALQLTHTRVARVREIQMSVDGCVCVVARSVLSLAAWQGPWQALRGLGRRPLADLLYDDRGVSRSHFESARLRHPDQLAKLAQRLDSTGNPSAQPSFWARRSIFWRQGHALLVTECFLPDFWKISLHKAGQAGIIGR